jgi:hypothetical protein
MQKTARKPMSMRDNWERLEPRYGEEIGYRASIGLLALSTDRSGAFDT